MKGITILHFSSEAFYIFQKDKIRLNNCPISSLVVFPVLFRKTTVMVPLENSEDKTSLWLQFYFLNHLTPLDSKLSAK
jgi:hypothetical protein